MTIKPHNKLTTLLYKLYTVVYQYITPPPQLHRFSVLTPITNFIGYVLHWLQNYITVFKLLFFTGNFKIGYNYIPYCTTKYIFILEKNKFD